MCVELAWRCIVYISVPRVPLPYSKGNYLEKVKVVPYFSSSALLPLLCHFRPSPRCFGYSRTNLILLDTSSMPGYFHPYRPCSWCCRYPTDSLMKVPWGCYDYLSVWFPWAKKLGSEKWVKWDIFLKQLSPAIFTSEFWNQIPEILPVLQWLYYVSLKEQPNSHILIHAWRMTI